MPFSLFRCGCGARDQRESIRRRSIDHTKRFHSVESQYEFLSIGNVESVFGTPRSSLEITLEKNGISHHTVLVNGVRYHPYSSLFGYSVTVDDMKLMSSPVSADRDSSGPPAPYDFSVEDEKERELQLWVRNRYSDPPAPMLPMTLPVLENLPAVIKEKTHEIVDLTDEEEVIRPFELLEQLRKEISKPSLSEFKDIPEHDRYIALDFLVIDEVMHRLRWKYPRIKTVSSLLESIPIGEVKCARGWHYECTNDVDIWTRTENDGSLSVRCRSVQNQPLFNAISLINEIDLHPLFMPHLAKAIQLHRFPGCGKRAQLLARYIYNMPIPFASRDTVLFAFGCNAINVPGVDGIIISSQSIPDDVTDWWGHSVPPPDKFVREKVRGMSFVMRPIGTTKTELTIIANLDKQIALVPQSIINWLIKDMIKGLYKNMIKLNAKFPSTEFAKRVDLNPEFYNWMKETLEKHELH